MEGWSRPSTQTAWSSRSPGRSSQPTTAINNRLPTTARNNLRLAAGVLAAQRQRGLRRAVGRKRAVLLLPPLLLLVLDLLPSLLVLLVPLVVLLVLPPRLSRPWLPSWPVSFSGRELRAAPL